jgi:radical SAM-linked protein
VAAAWHRALRRADAPLAHTQGFHPHARIAFSAALPTFEESLGEVMDVVLIERRDVDDLVSRLRSTAPEGFAVLGGREVPLGAPSAMSLVVGARYAIALPDLEPDVLAEAIQRLLSASSWPIVREKGKGESVPMDLRPMVHSLTLRPEGVDAVLVGAEGRGPRPRELCQALGADPTLARVVRRDTLAWSDGALVPLEQVPLGPVAPVAVAEVAK